MDTAYGGHGRSSGARTWRERLLELVGLVGVVDAEGVEVPGAAHLELDGALGPLDPHGPRVLPPRRQQEVLDLVDLLRLPRKKVGGNANESANAIISAAHKREVNRPRGSWEGEEVSPWWRLGWKTLPMRSCEQSCGELSGGGGSGEGLTGGRGESSE